MRNLTRSHDLVVVIVVRGAAMPVLIASSVRVFTRRAVRQIQIVGIAQIHGAAVRHLLHRLRCRVSC